MKQKETTLSYKKQPQHIFLVGAKSIGTYGGYETFVNKITEYHQNNEKIQYHIACKANGTGYMDETKLSSVIKKTDSEFIYQNARCFKIKVPQIGSAQAIYYDVKALVECCKYIKKNNIEHPIIYIMACRIGPFIGYFQRKIHKYGGKIYLNPDGNEWKRAVWKMYIRKYWRLSEKLMVKYSDLIICDSKNIEKYIKKNYSQYKPNTIFIAYGAETRPSTLSDDSIQFLNWLKRKDLLKKEYYLVVGRFVPENNYETMIREFIKSKSKHDFVIITKVNNKFLKKLEEKLHYKSEKNIKFVGTVYDQELLKKIRENAFGYFHGHEVGGTNPSLLEALASTDLNLLLNVEFNHEVAGDAALYWTKEDGNLAKLIKETDVMNKLQIEEYSKKAKNRISSAYSWQYISDEYEKVFLTK